MVQPLRADTGDTCRLPYCVHLEAPSHVIAHRFLSAALALSGRKEEAHIVLLRTLEIQPDYSIEHARRSRMGCDWMMNLFTEGLAEAVCRSMLYADENGRRRSP